jgi:hypothetical protein
MRLVQGEPPFDWHMERDQEPTGKEGTATSPPEAETEEDDGACGRVSNRERRLLRLRRRTPKREGVPRG